MNESLIKMSKTTGLAIPIAIVVLGIFAGYLLYSQWLVDTVEVIPDPPKQANDNLSKFKDKAGFDFKFLDDPAFKSLKLLGEVPVVPGATGKTDLFAPF